MKKNRKQIVIRTIFVISITTAIGFITFFGKDEKRQPEEGQSKEEILITTEKEEEKPEAELGKKKSEIKEKEAKQQPKKQLKKEEKKEDNKKNKSEVKKTEEPTEKKKEKKTENITEKESTYSSKGDTEYKEEKKTEKNTEERKNIENSTSNGHIHDFKPVYETIHHDEEGYIERTHIQPWDEYVYEWHYYCTKCGFDLTVNCGGATNAAGIAHLETHENGSSYQLKESDVVKEVIHHEERIEEEYIVTKEAYDEVILVYYQCSCGEIKFEP